MDRWRKREDSAVHKFLFPRQNYICLHDHIYSIILLLRSIIVSYYCYLMWLSWTSCLLLLCVMFTNLHSYWRCPWWWWSNHLLLPSWCLCDKICNIHFHEALIYIEMIYMQKTPYAIWGGGYYMTYTPSIYYKDVLTFL